MNCIETQKRIPAFINGRMKDEDIIPFISHIKTCSECKEELEFNYCLLTAIKQLEDDEKNTDNFILDMNLKLTMVENDYRHRKKTVIRKKAFLILEILVMGILLGIQLFYE